MFGNYNTESADYQVGQGNGSCDPLRMTVFCFFDLVLHFQCRNAVYFTLK